MLYPLSYGRARLTLYGEHGRVGSMSREVDGGRVASADNDGDALVRLRNAAPRAERGEQSIGLARVPLSQCWRGQ